MKKYRVINAGGGIEHHKADYHEISGDWLLLMKSANNGLITFDDDAVAAFHRPQSVLIEK